MLRRFGLDCLLSVSVESASVSETVSGFQPRHIARSVRISRTTRTCTFHNKGYGAYQTGTTAEVDPRYATRYSLKRPNVPYSHSLLHRFQPKP